MVKKYGKYVFIVLSIILFTCYYYPFSISKITVPYTGNFTPDTVDVMVNFSPSLRKDFEVNNANLAKELYLYLENLKIRRVMIPPNSYKLETIGSYFINLQSKEGKYLAITIFNTDYISINGRTYKSFNKIDLKKIYKIVLLDQDKEEIDEYYLNIIEQSE